MIFGPMPPGPWSREKNEYRFRFCGYPCLVLRAINSGFHLCGYVGLSPGHPWHGHDRALESWWSVPSHGGITYTRASHPETGEPTTEWWVGFDCAHWLDYLPLYALLRSGEPLEQFGTYRTAPYVARVVRELARAAHAADPHNRIAVPQEKTA